MHFSYPRNWAVVLSTLLQATNVRAALSVDLSDTDSIKAGLSTLAYDMMGWYLGNQTGQTPGLLPYWSPTNPTERYYWWMTGAMFGTMVDYWYYTGDTTYNDEITTGLLWQATSVGSFNPTNQSQDMGNDDQSFWAFTVMEAAEYNFPNPPAKDWQWLALAQSVFNQQAGRWNTATCGGGLNWQVFPEAAGYSYKNTISNAALFQMGARLAKFTGNQTYADWSTKIYQWMEDHNVINATSGAVWDGTSTPDNCTVVDEVDWSYNPAVLVYGAAVMYNITTGDTQSMWQARTTLLIQGMSIYFPNNILTEISCENLAQGCDNDQQSFKAYVGRYFAASTRVASFTYDLVNTWLTDSGNAALKTCTGGTSGNLCGLSWTNGTYDGWSGVGEQMNVMEVIGAQIMYTLPGPLTKVTGGTSKGDPSAGGSLPIVLPGELTSKITTGDRVGSWAVTVVICVAIIGGGVWMVW